MPRKSQVSEPLCENPGNDPGVLFLEEIVGREISTYAERRVAQAAKAAEHSENPVGFIAPFSRRERKSTVL